MRSWSAERVAQAAGGWLVGGGRRLDGGLEGGGEHGGRRLDGGLEGGGEHGGRRLDGGLDGGGERGDPGAPPAGPLRAVIDSRQAGPGTLFVGLPGSRGHGGAFAAQALAAGAWGVLSTPAHVEPLPAGPGIRIAARDPLAALQSLAREWRRELAAPVIGVTGSTGKTTTKELLQALLAPHRRVVASRANHNTEIGLPLELLAAAPDTEVLVLEMAMRGPGQIAELARIAEPDVGVIVSIGPVHLELLGSLEAIAAAKAELIAALAPGATAVVPAGEPLLAAHLRADVETVRFGEGGEVSLARETPERLVIAVAGDVEPIELEVPFTQAHLRANLLAAVAAALAVGVRPGGRVDFQPGAGRGRRVRLPGGVTLIDDCYNANPMSMQAALEDLAATPAPQGRRVAVLGDMLELGPRERRFHVELGRQARAAGVQLLIAVGALAGAAGEGFGQPSAFHHCADAQAAAMLLRELVAPGDVILVKGSRAVALERVCEAMRDEVPA
jgi:UDP-N-acetylmuramoyl-tripeptide--D-alanyl-D-alanine ligase